MAPQSERSKIDQIVAEFFAKTLHIILESRIPCFSLQTQDALAISSVSSSEYSFAVRPKDRWFNLVLGDCPDAQSSAEPWRRFQLEPMVVDILLLPSTVGVLDRQISMGTSCQKLSNDQWTKDVRHYAGVEVGSSYGTVLERWVVKYERRNKAFCGMRRSRSGETLTAKDASRGDARGSHATEFNEALKASARGSGTKAWIKSERIPQLPPFSSHVIEVPGLYKRVVILIRSLYCKLRTLPAHRLFRIANSSSGSRGFRLSHRVSATPPPLTEALEVAMATSTFTPVDTPTGRICLSVAYHHTTAMTALEIMPSVHPRIIQDYVGSPNTDPIRRISSASYLGAVSGGGISGRVGVHVVSLPSSLPNSPSLARRHSWNDGMNKVQTALLPPSSPSLRNSRSPSPSCPHDFISNSPHPSSPLRYSPSPRSSPSHSSYTRHGSHPSSFHPTEASSSPIPIQEHCPSPPFSPSISSSSPSSYLSPESCVNMVDTCNSSAPVSIPRSSVAQIQRLVMMDVSNSHHGKSALPPPSPRSKSVEPPLQALSSNTPSTVGQISHQLLPGMHAKVATRLPISTLAESSTFLSSAHPYRSCKLVGDDKGGEGLLSGLKIPIYGSPRKSFTRSHSKNSLPDESDLEDFACPFAVDDDELEYCNRLETSDSTDKGTDCYDGIIQKSQDAAVGALVRVLKSAAPLRDLSTSVDADGAEGRPFGLARTQAGVLKSGGSVKSTKRVSLHSGIRNSTLFGSREHGSVFLLQSPPEATMHTSMDLPSHKSCKTTADALEELRNHKEMRDFLLRQCGRQAAVDIAH